MVIRKLNSVFARHGRVLFGLITIVIIIAFMGFMQPGSGFGNLFSSFGDKNNYGEIFGETVTNDQVLKKADRDLIITDLIYNIGLNSYAAASRAQANAFRNLCWLAVAKRRGITASNKEITDFIAARSKFINKETGKFDTKLYSAYIDGDLKSNGFSAKDLDKAVREHLVISKLGTEIQNSVVVTDDEVNNFYKFLNEKYYVSSCTFKQDQYLKKVKVTTEEAKEFFKAGPQEPEEYIPGRSKVLLVEFRYDAPAFKQMAIKEITPKDVEEFYNKNKNLFMKHKAGQKPVPVPFEKSKKKAQQILEQRYAKKFANTKATEFADAAYDLVGDSEAKEQRKAFESTVKKFNYKTIETKFFSDNAKSIGNINEPGIVREVVSLAEVPVSNPVTGTEAAYVAFVINRVQPRPALFEEVKDKVIEKLKKRKALKMARSQARELVAKLQKMDKAARMKFVATSKAPKFEMLKAFSLMAPLQTPQGGIVAGMCRELKNGAVAPVQNTVDGAVVAVMRKRILPAMSGLDKQKKAMLKNIYKRQKLGAAEAAFFSWLQTKCKQRRQDNRF